jgi:hypothetical protein
MNPRSIRKRLMCRRVDSLWGPRACLTVRIPLSALPERPPAIPKTLGKQVDGEAKFLRTDDQGRAVVTTVDEVFVVDEPEGIAFREEEHGFAWIEIVERTFEDYDGPNEQIVAEKRGDPEIEALVSAREAWFDRYLRCSGQGVPFLDAFVRARTFAAAMYSTVDDETGSIVLDYRVQWYRPSYKRRFCADLAGAMAQARKAGVIARVSR